MSTKKKSNLPFSEITFCKIKFPKSLDKIRAAYKYKLVYDDCYKDLRTLQNKLFQKDVNIFDENFVLLAALCEKLCEIAPLFKIYLTTSDSHHKKKAKILNEIFEGISLEEGREEAKRLLKDLEPISKVFKKYSLTISQASKLAIKINDSKRDLLKIRNTLENVSEKPKRHFRYLYKNI